MGQLPIPIIKRKKVSEISAVFAVDPEGWRIWNIFGDSSSYRQTQLGQLEKMKKTNIAPLLLLAVSLTACKPVKVLDIEEIKANETAWAMLLNLGGK